MSLRTLDAVQALDRLRTVLFEDKIAAHRLAGEQPSRFARRTYVRTVFALVEGMTFAMKDIALAIHEGRVSQLNAGVIHTEGNMSHSSSLLRSTVVLLASALVFSCTAEKQLEAQQSDVPTVVRIISFMVPQGHEAAWSAACRRLSHAATEAQIDANWLIYRVDHRQYYLVTFGSLAEFRNPESIVQGFVRHNVNVLNDAFKQLHTVPYEVTSDEVWEQVRAWSTTSDMNSLTHPGVDQRSYRVDSGQISAVDSVLTEMAALLTREHYPYPTEGFRIALDTGLSVHVISFFGAPDDYYSLGEPAAFLAARGHRQEWLKLVERLDAISHSQSRTESRYVHELSYDPGLSEESAESSG